MVRTVSAPLARAQSAYLCAVMRPGGAEFSDGARLAAVKNALMRVAEATLKEAGDFEAATADGGDGADVAFQVSLCVDNWMNAFGQTALFVAALYGRDGVARWLVEACRADVNKADRHGWSPVVVASRFGRADVALLLCKAGAAVNKPTTKARGGFPEGVTALDVAVVSEFKALAKQLKRHKARRGVRDLQHSVADRADAAARAADKAAASDALAAHRDDEADTEDRLMAQLNATAAAAASGPQKKAAPRPKAAAAAKKADLGEAEFERTYLGAKAGGGGDAVKDAAAVEKEKDDHSSTRCNESGNEADGDGGNEEETSSSADEEERSDDEGLVEEASDDEEEEDEEDEGGGDDNAGAGAG